MNDCIFCKIGRGEIPHNVIDENDDFAAFLDIHPAALGHTLLVPKKHFTWMQDCDDQTISGIFVMAKKIMQAMKKSLACDYVQVSIIGKDIPHFHIHLIPRHFGDNLAQTLTLKYKPGEAKEIMDRITRAL